MDMAESVRRDRRATLVWASDLPEKALARLATSEVPSEMLALRGETATDGISSVRPPNKNRLRNSCFCRVAGMW